MRKNKRTTILGLFLIISLINMSIYPAQAEEGRSLPQAGKALSLEECIAFALQHSFEVQLARLDYLIAETDMGIAEAVFDTVLFSDISYEEDKREQISVFAGDREQTNIYSVGASKKLAAGTELTLSLSDTRTWNNSGFLTKNPAHTAEVTFDLRQPLAKNYFGYVDRRNISVTGLAIQNADLDTQERIESLIADVEKAYWQWVFSKERLKIHRELLEKARELYETNARNYDVGRIERGDFLASQANVLIRERSVSIEENRFRRAEENLKLLLNMDSAAQIYPAQTLEYSKTEVNLGNCLRQAFKLRRDYQKAKRDVKIKDIVLQTKANERWPEIDLVASLVANGISSDFNQATKRITSEDNTGYFAGLEISIPIENNLARSEFKQATHDKEKALVTLKNIERTVVTDVGNAFRDYVTFENTLATLIEAAQLQHEKLKEEERRLSYGRSDTKRLIDYQEDYLRAQLEVALGIFELEISIIDLEKLLNIILAKYEAML